MNAIINHICVNDNVILCVHDELEGDLLFHLSNLLRSFPNFRLLTLRKISSQVANSPIRSQILSIYFLEECFKEFSSAHILVLAGVKVGISSDGQLSRSTENLLKLMKVASKAKIFCLHDPQILFALSGRRKSSVVSPLSSSKGKELVRAFEKIAMQHMVW